MGILIIIISITLNAYGQSKSVEQTFGEYLTYVKNNNTEMTNYMHSHEM